MRPRARARPEAALFALAFTAYAYFFQGGGWNAAVRFDLVRAIVEQGTVRIDGYQTNTGDLAYRDGHYYCDKAPGLSFAAVPVYAALYPLRGEGRLRARFVSGAAWLCTILTVALPSTAAVVMLYVLGGTLGLRPRARAALAAAYALGTLAFPYSTLFYGHQLAAALLFLAFGLLARARDMPPRAGRLLAAGALLGSAIAVEYPAALAAAAIGVYAAVVVRPRRAWLWLVAGGLPPLIGLAVYHAAAFGSPFMLPYAFSTDAPRHQGALLGFGLPRLDVVGALLFSPYRGLFYSAPWLLLALPGGVRLWGLRRHRAEVAVAAAIALLYLILNAGLGDWHGGWGTGPRHLVPALPFLALAAGGLLAGRTPARAERAGYAAVVGLSAALMLVATAVQPEVPRWFGRPFQEFLFPAFVEGRLATNTLPIHTGVVHERREAWNGGELLGLEGLATLLPLLAALAVEAVWLYLSASRIQQPE